MKRTDKETELKIIGKYNSGASMKATGEAFGVSSTTVKNILERYNIPKRTHGGIYQLPEEKIIQRYQSGESCQVIADDYKVTFGAIRDVLEKYNIARDNKYHNLTLNHNYFTTINTYDKAYFLGLLITDGNITLNENGIRIEFTKEDGENIFPILDKKTGNTNQLYYREDRNTLRWGLRSKQWKTDLAKYGVVPQKTSTVYLPQIDKNLMPHLIRGLIEGDGWISAKSPQIGFCGNKQIVTQVRDYLINELNVYPVKILHPEENLWQVAWSSKKDISAIGHYIYDNKQDCFFNRKFNNFQLLIGNTEVTN